MNIEGRTAVITGASSGIGRETAREFARGRANVVLASRSRGRLQQLADDLAPGVPGRALVVPTDVTDRLAVEALMRRTVEEFGVVDILINNAGVGLFAPIADGEQDHMRRLFEVNLWGAINCIQAAVPYMLGQGRGHIVNISSVAGKVAFPFMGAYCASKFALTAVSDSLRSELAGSGIGVSTVYPGLTETSFQENMTSEMEMPEMPPLVPVAPASAVARRIVQAVRFGLRDAYVSPQDIAAVGIGTVAPFLVDWGARLWLSAQRPASAPAPAPSASEVSGS